MSSLWSPHSLAATRTNALVAAAGETILPNTEVKRLLDLARSVAKPAETPIPEAYLPSNLRTQDGRELRVYSELLTAAIRSIVQINEKKNLDSLFSGHKTTALTGSATGWTTSSSWPS